MRRDLPNGLWEFEEHEETKTRLRGCLGRGLLVWAHALQGLRVLCHPFSGFAPLGGRHIAKRWGCKDVWSVSAFHSQHAPGNFWVEGLRVWDTEKLGFGSSKLPQKGLARSGFAACGRSGHPPDVGKGLCGEALRWVGAWREPHPET